LRRGGDLAMFKRSVVLLCIPFRDLVTRRELFGVAASGDVRIDCDIVSEEIVES